MLASFLTGKDNDNSWSVDGTIILYAVPPLNEIYFTTIFKIIKLSVNTAAIIWNVVEVFQGGVSDLRIMILIVSAVLLFAQIIMEIVINLWVYYFDNLRIAFVEDIRGIDMDSNFVTKFVTKSLGIKKALKEVRSDDYFSEEEKKISEKQRRKK